MRYIGDVHGRFAKYLELIEGQDESIQVGDFGVGFAEVPQVGPGHRFIRGNHDDPHRVAQHNWIPDGTSEGERFFVGGGESIDRHNRIQGRDWWPEEQLDWGELYGIMDSYEAAKPNVMVSHECPHDVVGEMFGRSHTRYINPSRTSQALSGMLYVHRPKVWIMGHWHQRVDKVIQGTRFICLEINGVIDLPF